MRQPHSHWAPINEHAKAKMNQKMPRATSSEGVGEEQRRACSRAAQPPGSPKVPPPRTWFRATAPPPRARWRPRAAPAAGKVRQRQQLSERRAARPVEGICQGHGQRGKLGKLATDRPVAPAIGETTAGFCPPEAPLALLRRSQEMAAQAQELQSRVLRRRLPCSLTASWTAMRR